MTRFAITLTVCTALAASAALCIGQQAVPNSSETGNSISAANSLLLLSANILQPEDPSDPVVVYRISDGGNLVPFVTVLEAQSGGPLRNSLTGVYSVHDIGSYLIVDYPHIFPHKAIFVPKARPESFHKIDLDPEHPNDLIVDKLNHDFSETSDGAICDLWPVFSQPSVPDGKGGMTQPKESLRSACEKPGGQPLLKVDEWDDLKNLRYDGDMRYTEVSFLTDKGGKLTEVRLGGQPFPLGNMPAGFDAPSDNRGIMLTGENSRYMVISILDAQDSQNRNANVFVKTLSDGKWKRLPVPPVPPLAQDNVPLELRDKMYYRLFDDWSLKSASFSPSISAKTAATAERSAALDSGPAPWLYLVQKNARLVAALGGPLLPLANPEEPEISRHQEKLLIQEYASLARFRKRRQFSNMLGIPEMWIGEFFVWLAFWSSVDGDATSAVGHAVNASERLMRLGVAWDKRLHLKEWLFVADAIARGAGQLKQARKSAEFIESPQALHELFHHQVPSGSALVAALSDFRTTLPGDGHKTDHAVGERLQQYLTGIDRNQSTKQIGEFPNLHSIPVWNAGDFPIVQALEASFDGIREELQSSQENWNTLILFGHGHKHLEVCVLLPLITTIIERYETVRTVSGTVVFRRLRARSHTNPHKGPTNVRVRCCLPIQVPEGDVGLRVGHELLAWSAGNCLVFSDFEDHEMWNNTDADCLLLEIDLWHPLLSKAEISSLRGLHKYSQFFEEKSQKNSPAAVVNPFILHNGLKARSGQKDTDVCWSEDPLPIGRAI